MPPTARLDRRAFLAVAVTGALGGCGSLDRGGDSADPTTSSSDSDPTTSSSDSDPTPSSSDSDPTPSSSDPGSTPRPDAVGYGLGEFGAGGYGGPRQP